jgi:hypothetical protein
MSRRGCSLSVNASGFDPHRASISSRFGQVTGGAALRARLDDLVARIPEGVGARQLQRSATRAHLRARGACTVLSEARCLPFAQAVPRLHTFAEDARLQARGCERQLQELGAVNLEEAQRAMNFQVAVHEVLSDGGGIGDDGGARWVAEAR